MEDETTGDEVLFILQDEVHLTAVTVADEVPTGKLVTALHGDLRERKLIHPTCPVCVTTWAILMSSVMMSCWSTMRARSPGRSLPQR